MTDAEKITNYETYKHIDVIIRLLVGMQAELGKRIISHDRSKLADPELKTFTEFTPKLKDSTYGSAEYKGFLKDMAPALAHHYANNRHHAEFFENGMRGMTIIDLLEMIVDWRASTLRHKDGDIMRSIELNQERFGYSDDIKSLLINTIAVLDKYVAPLESQKDL